MASTPPGEGTTVTRRPGEGLAARTPADAAELAHEDVRRARQAVEIASAAVGALGGTRYPESFDRTLGWLRGTLASAEAKVEQDSYTGPAAARVIAAEVEETAKALAVAATGTVPESGRYRKQARYAAPQEDAS